MPREMMYKTAKFPPNYVLDLYGVSYSAYEQRKRFLDNMEDFRRKIEDKKSSINKRCYSVLKALSTLKKFLLERSQNEQIHIVKSFMFYIICTICN